MKISTSFLFDRATERMSTIQNKLATTQAQMAESKQILSPSDAPDQAAAIQRLKGEVQRQDSHMRTLDVAMRRYTAEETALSASNDILIRMKELGLQAANDTMAPDDRKAVGVEMKALRDQLLSLGNTRDDSGNYLFSGTRVNTPSFAEKPDGHVIYQGDQTQTRIPAGVERNLSKKDMPMATVSRRNLQKSTTWYDHSVILTRQSSSTGFRAVDRTSAVMAR